MWVDDPAIGPVRVDSVVSLLELGMAEKLMEIRWHGRGGQGAKTAATMVAEEALEEGKYSQGFPEYGP